MYTYTIQTQQQTKNHKKQNANNHKTIEKKNTHTDVKYVHTRDGFKRKDGENGPNRTGKETQDRTAGGLRRESSIQKKNKTKTSKT